MSHIVEQPCTITSLDALAAVCSRLGLEFRWNKTELAWWGHFVGDSAGIPHRDPSTYGTCLHAIGRMGKTPQSGSCGEWEIGVVRRADGNGYTLVYDQYGTPGRNLEAAAGQNLTKLIDEYNIEVSTRQLRRQGYTVNRRTLPNGQTRLHCYAR